MGLRGVPVGDLLLQRQAAAILGFGHEIRVEAPVRHGQPEGRFRVIWRRVPLERRMCYQKAGAVTGLWLFLSTAPG
jgi:hypothetical protein